MKSTFSQFIRTYMIVAILLLGFAGGMIWMQTQAYNTSLQKNSSELVAARARVLRSQAALNLGNTIFMADQTARIMGQSLTGDKIFRLKQLFFSFMARHEVFDQIRFINADGKELIRFNASPSGPVEVPQDELQDKSEKDYFKQAMELGLGGVYISPLELNVDNGKVERPFKPVLRFSAPAIDGDYHKLGVVVLNFEARYTLQSLRSGLEPGAILMANDKGQWIMAPEQQAEWGMSLPGRSQRGILHLWPDAWNHMASRNGGQFVTMDGLFTFERVNPLQDAWEDHKHRGVASEEWVLLNRIPPEKMAPDWLGVAWLSLAAALLLTGSLTWFWSRAKKQAVEAEAGSTEHMKKAMAMSEASLDALVMIDDKGTILFWNKAAEDMFGYTEQEAMGRDVHELLVYDEPMQIITEGLETFAKTGEGKVVGNVLEYSSKRKDGQVFSLERSVASFEMGGRWYAASSMRDISDRKKAERQLKVLASTDPLTGLANRREFLALAEKEASRSARSGTRTSIVMIDIDHFKNVNDTWGHDVGDEALKLLARTGMEHVRKEDVLARLGGEEFALLLPDTHEERALKAAERLRKAVEQASLEVGNGTLRFTVSLGVASAQGAEVDVETLLQRADAALYRAKGSGRNRVEKG